MSKPRYTLIQLQEAAIARLNLTRTSEKRHAKWRKSIRKWYLEEVTKMWGSHVPDGRGDWTYDAATLMSWDDVLDMWRLRLRADAAEEV